LVLSRILVKVAMANAPIVLMVMKYVDGLRGRTAANAPFRTYVPRRGAQILTIRDFLMVGNHMVGTLRIIVVRVTS
jgi:hypothetical protein